MYPMIFFFSKSVAFVNKDSEILYEISNLNAGS